MSLPEIITFGEAMVRLMPPGCQRLEQTRTFDVQVGGAELNTASALACLGRSVGWVSRLTRNGLGRLIAAHARAAGVATEHILWTDEDRVGVYYLEQGAAPRPSAVYYDRQGSAAARLCPGLIDWPRVLTGGRWFHLTGITPAISSTSAAASLEALQTAHRLGLRTSLDLNYRSKLWSVTEAADWLKLALPFCTVLLASRDDVATMFGIEADTPEQAAQATAERFGLAVVVFSLRETLSVWRNRFGALAYAAGRVLRSRLYEVEIVDRLGTGDAFDAGLIDGLLDDDLERGLELGAAAGALKHTIPGDLAWFTRAEVEAVAGGTGLRIRR